MILYLESQLHDGIRADFVFLAKFFAVVLHLQHIEAQGFGDGHVPFLGLRNAVFDAVVQLEVFKKNLISSGKSKQYSAILPSFLTCPAASKPDGLVSG